MVKQSKQFSVEEKLISLIRLQKIFTQLDAVYTLRGDLPVAVEALSQNLDALQRDQADLEARLNGMKEFVDEQKLFIKESEQEIKKYEKQSSQIKNSREFESINKAIENSIINMRMAERKIKDVQEEMRLNLDKWETMKAEITDKEKHLQLKKTELEEIIAATQGTEAALLESVTKIKREMDPELAYLFGRIRNNYPATPAVASIVRNACGGCFSSIPPQRQIDVGQRKSIITCENCGRVLVDETLFTATQ